MKMRTSNILILAGVAFAAQCLIVSSSVAQELYHVVVSTVSVETNASGGLSYEGFGNREIIRQVASDLGITNRTGMRLVYNRTADAVEVVRGTNNTVLATPMTFGGGVSLSKTNDRVRERLSFVFVNQNQQANGSLRATEHYVFGTSNQVTHFNLEGRLQFAVAANGTNAATIYSGNISAGTPRHDDHD